MYLYNIIFIINSVFLLKTVADINKDEDNVYKEDTTEEWIVQPLDHFNDNDQRTFKMRYYKKLNYWEENGPIYLLLGAESRADSGELNIELLIELANDTNGALFLSEHRYYGESIPLNGSLKYLRSQQAIADNARLLKTIKSDPKFGLSKVVVIGGSYAGNLASWIKLIYPNLVDAAISVSGPVLAKKDFFEYVDTINDSLEKYGGAECLEKVTISLERFAELLKYPNGIKQLKKDDNICEYTDMTVLENQQTLFVAHYDDIAFDVQYGTPDTIKQFCKSYNGSIVNFDSIYILKDENENCIDYDLKRLAKNLKAKKTSDYYWTYQTCTEFGYFTTIKSTKLPNVTVDYFINMCKYIFGDYFNASEIDFNIDHTNMMYGGKNINVSNVVFVNGDIDPWGPLGVLKDLPNAPARVIEGTSHCALFQSYLGEPKELTLAKKYVKKLVKSWIGY